MVSGSRPPGVPFRGGIIGPCTILLVLALQTAAFPDVACEDIAKVDLANTTLPIPGGEPLSFSNGLACPPDYDGDPGCEWRSEIDLDLLTTPEPGVRLRVLVISENHMRGSGFLSGGRVIAYRCERGQLVAAFSERFECGAAMTRARGSTLLLSMPRGGPKYAHGCQDPSTSQLYTWCTQEHTYRLDPVSGGSGCSAAGSPQVHFGAVLPRPDVGPPVEPR